MLHFHHLLDFWKSETRSKQFKIRSRSFLLYNCWIGWLSLAFEKWKLNMKFGEIDICKFLCVFYLLIISMHTCDCCRKIIEIFKKKLLLSLCWQSPYFIQFLLMCGHMELVIYIKQFGKCCEWNIDICSHKSCKNHTLHQLTVSTGEKNGRSIFKKKSFILNSWQASPL